MNTSKLIKLILFALIYGSNLFFALALWLCGESGNIMLGIIFIIFYRLTLWFSPAAISIICWLPLKPGIPTKKKLMMNLILLLVCGMQFLLCYLLFGNWF